MDKPITIYGAAGSGSVPIEAALTLLGLSYEVIERADLGALAADGAYGAINPLRQVPALVFPGGELMTESAAMLIWLADRYPEARLAPPPLHRRRPAFLRWMAYVSSAIYALYWIRDDPSRLSDDPAAQAAIKARTAERIADCWRMMDAQVTPGRYLLGEEIGVLDLYVTVISRWGPRRRRFYEVAPKMSEVVRRVDADPALADVWAARFPFSEGWEG
ncbi:MAG: glutathione S-transferase family protein [Caulobacteraceae bacterium]|nr:glutathione S-transferase family protein [Caulobacteraceae bacterium]